MMIRRCVFLLLVFVGLQGIPPESAAQEGNFGKNKVQYNNFDWHFIQSAHFDIYFDKGSENLAQFVAEEAESSLSLIARSFRYQITNRIPVVVYNSHNQFQQTNVVSSYLEEGIGGVTELFKNRVVIPFEGDYKKFRHVIHHELVHAVLNDMFYGGSIQSIISNNITLQLPLWFNEGLAEYEALKWDTNSDMFIRDATIHEYLPPIARLDGYFAYRGGQSMWNYIATKYGDQKIGEILTRIKGTRSLDQGFRAAIGLNVEELSERWQKEQKVLYWPDIAKRVQPEDYARRLTDHTKDGSFYNTSPAISRQGDRIAFISNRDDYFDVFLMNATDGSIQGKLVSGQRTPDFEELHLLTPGMSFSPDGRRLALAAKSGSQDAIIIMNVDNRDEEQKLVFDLDGIYSVDWSPAMPEAHDTLGSLVFVGMKSGRSDIYLYDLDTRALTNLTDDIFSDADPTWSPDGTLIYFASDRRDNISPQRLPADFRMHRFDYSQLDLYSIDVATRKITRVTDMPNSDETSPVAAPDGKHLYFISDMNGINNIYIKDLSTDSIAPRTNSLSGVYQLSLSRDGNKMVFSSLTNAGFDMFLMRTPLEHDVKMAQLEPTEFIKRLVVRQAGAEAPEAKADTAKLGSEVVIRMDERDSTRQYGNDVRIDLRNYVFRNESSPGFRRGSDSSAFASVTENVDTNGNFKISKYKLNFSPDIVYGNAGYNTFYGVQGSTVMAFSDMLGDHQIYLLTNLLFDLKNSDYAIAYLYLPKRIDYGIQGFHSARFLILDDEFGQSLYRFRNYGATLMASFPINRFDRLEGTFSWFNISRENLDYTFAPSQRRSLLLPSLSYVHDNSLWGLIAPDNGTRYNLNLMASPKIGGEALGFYTLSFDYRTYSKLGKNYSAVLRLAGGGSFGSEPQRFIVGGVDNWINRKFEGDRIPIENAEDFVFLTTGVPLRGYNYGSKVGSKYAIMNAEFRFPLFGYLTAGPLPVLFQSFTGSLFLDVGSAWNNASDFRAFDRNQNGDPYLKDLLVGTGYGVRMIFLGFLLKMDVAWGFDWLGFSSPKYYFSLGADI